MTDTQQTPMMVPHQNRPLSKRSAKDYKFGTRIGEGSYSTVYAAQDINTNRTFAIKVLNKRHIVKEDKIKYVNIEKLTLHRLGQKHPGIVQLYYTFQDDASLFFVLDLAEYGELLSIIRKFGSLSEPVSKYYMTQIIDAVLFIHLKGVIHRDLKPENILVGYDFNLKITDFGAAKLLGPDKDDDNEKVDYGSVKVDAPEGGRDHKGSFVGTAEYVPPELLTNNVCGFESDIWALGCILYQLFSGNPPFKGSTEYLTFEKIIHVDYAYKPTHPVPENVKKIIDHVLVEEMSERWTLSDIMNSDWFVDVPWKDKSYIWNRRVPKIEAFTNNKASPYGLALKNGSNRDVSKSSFHHRLHNQIQNSEFDLVPSMAKKSYQPATKIKKGFGPGPGPNGLPSGPGGPAGRVNGANGVNLPNGPGANGANGASAPIGPNSQNGLQGPQNGKPGLPKSGLAPSGFPPSGLPPGSGLSSSNSALPAAALTPTSVTRPHYQQRPSGPRPVPVSHPSQNGKSPQEQNLRRAINLNSVGVPQARPPAVPAVPRSTQMNQRPPQRPVENPKSESPTVVAPTQKYQDSISSKELNSKIIEFSEISDILQPNEKILKMDTILKLYLSKEEINRTAGPPLDEDYMNDLMSKHQAALQKSTQVVMTVVTNQARVFFIDGDLNVMLIDLKANQGADYLMYDYEFESVAVENESDAGEVGEDVYGYLVLEVVRSGGDLILLKRINNKDPTAFTDVVKVQGKKGNNIKLGTNYGWIDCLLMAKEMVAKDKKKEQQRPKETKSKETKSKETKSKETKSKETKSKESDLKPKTSISSKESKKNNDKKNKTSLASKLKRASTAEPVNKGKGSVKTMNNFAYAAAAAAHK